MVGINHIALAVGDVDEAVEFYGRIFELDLRGRTLIVNLPGNPKAIEQSWPIVEPTLEHAANLLERG